MASYEYIYTMKGLSKAFPGGKSVLKDIWLSFLPGAKIGVLGLNGAGKSTLLRIMAGLDDQYDGEAWPADGVKVGFLPQEPELDPDKTVGDNVMDGVAETKALLDRFNDVSMRFAEELTDDEMNDLIAEQAELQDQIDAANAWELERTVEIAMDALRCPPGDADVTTLSGGERRRVALCRLLLSRPDMLLLDEPTNHLDAESVAWLERFLHEYPGTVVAVTHDRYFLDNVAGWILELDRGHGIPWKGNYSSWLEQKKQRFEQEGKEEASRQRTLQHELEWINASPRARQAKSKARIKAYETMLIEATERPSGTARIFIPPGPRLGDVVVEADHVSKGYGDKLLVEDMNFKLPPGGIVGVVGP
ncbi:MAG: ATP-binding cassette domain-containing protein, partial [bacterium]|nr:ATP-binding cassette domain-containing protein [bacterium]